MHKGGESEERLYIKDFDFREGSKIISVRKTAMPDIEGVIARHKARYHLVAFFCRKGMKVLDFPCGSGYGSEILADTGVSYEGYDIDQETISYCNHLYEGDFYIGDMTAPSFVPDNYDVIACIEGLEHIKPEFQHPLVKAFFFALKLNGTLIVSCPETPKEKSGPSDTNPLHIWELTKVDFETLLRECFCDTQVINVQDTLHNGQKANCLYGICRKGSK